MKERPILFSGAMVRALLDGSKTQTRRIVKLPHNNRLGQWEPTVIGGQNGGRTAQGAALPLQGGIWHTRTGDNLMCPYGSPGDRLYVRETHEVNRIGYEEDSGGHRRHHACVAYKADDGREQFPISVFQYEAFDAKESRGWTPSIHMPCWASRITLEVTGVRVERLRDISEEDAIAEGIERIATTGCDNPVWKAYDDPASDKGYLSPGYSYMTLWDSLNDGRGYGWHTNPWVWVIEFKRVTP